MSGGGGSVPVFQTLKEIGRTFRDAAYSFLSDNGMMLSAALAFYTALSFAPLLLIAIWFGSAAGKSSSENLVSEVRTYVGEGGTDAIRLVLENAKQQPTVGSIAGVASLGVLIVTATTIFVSLQHALNIVWSTEFKGGILKSLIYKRVIGFLMICGILAVLLGSVALSAGLSIAAGHAPAGVLSSDKIWSLIHVGVSLFIFTGLFAIMFRVLPDTDIQWKSVWFGAATTAALFIAGRNLAAYYLGRSAIGSAYGAGGALLVLLVWVYYSWAIVIFGAEYTHAWAERRRNARQRSESRVRGPAAPVPERA